MNSQYLKTVKLPDTPGVYFFKRGKEILYIGKATSLADRVKSYFSSTLMGARGPLVVQMVEEADSISYEEADSVLEALILEANLIKKHQPIFNTKEKDNKSLNYVVITKEDFPRILSVRGRELFSLLGKDKTKVKFEVENKKKDFKVREYFGPFPHGTSLRDALKIIRKIFTFRDNSCVPNQGKPCFNRQIGLCPGVCTGEVTKQEYAQIIRHISLFFSGKKKTLIKDLEKEMKFYAKAEEFEKANKTKKTIFALNHIQDVALIKDDIEESFGGLSSVIKTPVRNVFRIEAYDIAHMSGKEVVGVMVVMENGLAKKADYRKFKIRGLNGSGKNDDTGNLKEILTRRLRHLEWPLPNLIVIDGGVGQINAANDILKEGGFKIDTVAVTKDERHKPKGFTGESALIEGRKKEILLANSEAHRFAIKYHKNLRGKLIP